MKLRIIKRPSGHHEIERSFLGVFWISAARYGNKLYEKYRNVHKGTFILHDSIGANEDIMGYHTYHWGNLSLLQAKEIMKTICLIHTDRKVLNKRLKYEVIEQIDVDDKQAFIERI